MQKTRRKNRGNLANALRAVMVTRTGLPVQPRDLLQSAISASSNSFSSVQMLRSRGLLHSAIATSEGCLLHREAHGRKKSIETRLRCGQKWRVQISVVQGNRGRGGILQLSQYVKEKELVDELRQARVQLAEVRATLSQQMSDLEDEHKDRNRSRNEDP